MANFATEVAWIDSKWPIWSICNFSHLFSQNVAQNDSEWSISPDLQLFQSFPTKAACFSQKFKIFVSRGGGTSANFPDLQLFKSFPTEAAQNDPQWPILPLKWLGWTQNGQFWSICNFSPKMRLRLTQNGQFCPICNFSNHFPAKRLKFTCNSHFFPNCQLYPCKL